MGMIISRFRRKKTTTEILERLETKIKRIEQDGQNMEQTHRRIIGYIMVYSVGLYILFCILYYFLYVGKSDSWVRSAVYASPILVLPIIVIFIRASISRYYNWTTENNRIKLSKMRDEKKKLLEDVMNNETYKVAKEILEKYGSPEEQSKALKPFVPTTNVPGKKPGSNPISPVRATPGQLRQRQLALTSISIKNNSVVNSTAIYNGPRLVSDRLPRPIPNLNRSALEKVVDYVLKNGPNYRMALICPECYSHNGMAMIEEFDYVSYNCAYCGRRNAARKQRPAAPALRLISPRALTDARYGFFSKVGYDHGYPLNTTNNRPPDDLFRRGSAARRSAGHADRCLEYFVPRSLSEFNLSLSGVADLPALADNLISIE